MDSSVNGMSVDDTPAHDLGVADYFLIQWSGSAGMEVLMPNSDREKREDYRAKLTWNEILLDDFS